MELSKEKLDEIKADAKKEFPAITETFKHLFHRYGYERGATAYALKSLPIEKERDELKAERDRYREALEKIYGMFATGYVSSQMIYTAGEALHPHIEQVKP